MQRVNNFSAYSCQDGSTESIQNPSSTVDVAGVPLTGAVVDNTLRATCKSGSYKKLALHTTRPIPNATTRHSPRQPHVHAASYWFDLLKECTKYMGVFMARAIAFLTWSVLLATWSFTLRLSIRTKGCTPQFTEECSPLPYHSW